MGYDMYIEAPTEALLAKKEPGQAAYNAFLEAERTGAANKGELRQAWTKLYGEADYDPTYFRLNIFGMGRYRGYMDKLGMLDTVTTHPAWPKWEGDWPEEGSTAYAEREAELERIVSTAAESPIGLPEFKFGSNDGWLVTPDEIRAALASYDESRAREVVGPDEIDYWSQWIAFLNRAAQNGGFRVR